MKHYPIDDHPILGYLRLTVPCDVTRHNFCRNSKIKEFALSLVDRSEISIGSNWDSMVDWPKRYFRNNVEIFTFENQPY